VSVVGVAHIQVPHDLDRTKALRVLSDDATAADCAAMLISARQTNLLGGYEGAETQVVMMQVLMVEWEFATDEPEEAGVTMRRCIEQKLADEHIEAAVEVHILAAGTASSRCRTHPAAR
jgi:hypothetical protein